MIIVILHKGTHFKCRHYTHSYVSKTEFSVIYRNVTWIILKEPVSMDTQCFPLIVIKWDVQNETYRFISKKILVGIKCNIQILSCYHTCCTVRSPDLTATSEIIVYCQKKKIKNEEMFIIY